MTVTAALYCRVSTGSQAGKDPWASLPQQLADLRQLAQRMGFVVALEVEEQVSGAKTNRPGWAQVLAAVRAGQANAVLAVAVDRMTRSSRLGDFEALKDEMRALGARLVTARQGEIDLSGDPYGEARGDQDATYAKLERGVIRLRTYKGRKAKAEAGGYAGGSTPFGYRVAFDPATGARTFLVDEEAAAIVLELYERFAAGENRSGITTDFNRRGLPAPGRPGSGARGRHWYHYTATDLLANPAFAGLQNWRPDLLPDTPSTAFPPLVSLDLWRRVQQETGVRLVRNARGPIPPYPLSGLLRCPGCGMGMVHMVGHSRGKTAATKPYYRCHRDGRNVADVCTVRQHVREDLAESAVLAYLIEHLPRYVSGQDMSARTPRAASHDTSRQERELAKVRTQQARLIDMLLDDAFIAAGEDAIRRKMGEMTAKERALVASIAEVRKAAIVEIPRADRSGLRYVAGILAAAQGRAELRAVFEGAILTVVLVRTSLPPKSRPARLAVARMVLRNGDEI